MIISDFPFNIYSLLLSALLTYLLTSSSGPGGSDWSGGSGGPGGSGGQSVSHNFRFAIYKRLLAILLYC